MEIPKSQKPDIDWKEVEAAEKKTEGRKARRLEGELARGGNRGLSSVFGERREARLRKELESFRAMGEDWEEKARTKQQWLETTLEKMPGLKNPEKIKKEVRQEVEAYLAKARRARLEARARELRLAGTDTYEKRKSNQVMERSWKKLVAPFEELFQVYEQALNNTQEILREAEWEAVAARDRALEMEITLNDCVEMRKEMGIVKRLYRSVLGKDRGLESLIKEARGQLIIFEKQAKQWEKKAARLREALIKLEDRREKKETVLGNYKRIYEDKIKNFGADAEQDVAREAETGVDASLVAETDEPEVDIPTGSFTLGGLDASGSFEEEQSDREELAVGAPLEPEGREEPARGGAAREAEAPKKVENPETVGDYLRAWNDLYEQDNPELIFDLDAFSPKVKSVLDKKVSGEKIKEVFISLVEKKFVKPGTMAPWITEALERALPSAVFGKRLGIVYEALEKKPRPKYLGVEKKAEPKPEAVELERPERVEAHVLKSLKKYLLDWNKKYPRLALAPLNFPPEVLTNLQKGVKPDDAKNFLIGSLRIVLVNRGLAKPELLEILQNLSLEDILNGAKEKEIDDTFIRPIENEGTISKKKRESKAKMIEVGKDKADNLGRKLKAFVEFLGKRKEAGFNPYVSEEGIAGMKTSRELFLGLDAKIGASDFNKKLGVFVKALEGVGRNLGEFEPDNAESIQEVRDVFEDVEKAFTEVAESIPQGQKTKLVASRLNKASQLIGKKNDFLRRLQELKK